ncbi:MAG: hypothetical protein JKY37_31960 [Nannocystaceae bacterium]|nr:hypothetical protein [Nannocystaceae bacterium]
MKTLDVFTRGMALASLTLLVGCADDITNPFESGDSGSTGSSGGADDAMTTAADATVGSANATTGGAETTMGSADSGTTAASADGGTTVGVSDGSSSGGSSGTTSGDTTASTSGGSESDTGEESSSDDGPIGVVCPAGTLDNLPMTVNDSVVGQQDEFGGSCGGNGAPDMAFTLEAEVDGFYVFDTVGSNFDTVLYVLDGDCSGNELACNDDNTGTQSEVGVVLTTGQVVTVVVDSFGIAGGSFTLNATVFAGTCPDGDIGNTVPQTTMGDTTMSDNTLFGSCGGNLAGDESLTFVAPEAGIYTSDTLGSDYDTVLYVREDCSGAELGCNDDISGAESASQVNVTLEQDQSVVVVVDGNSEDGNYNLNVTLDECPDEALPSTIPQTLMGSTVAEIDSSQPSCSFGNTAPDRAFTFVAPSAGTYIFDTNGSTFDTELYVIDGESCNGAVTLGCDDDGGAGLQSLVLVNLAQDQQVTIVVDGHNAASGEYVLNIDALGGECPNADLGNTVPATAMGDTTASDDTIASSCGGLGSGDETFTFTAPQDGLYFMSTAASAYTAQVSVFDSADCSGAELACADDGVGVGLMTGQTVTVVIDGDNAEGVFDLSIDLDACPDGDLGNTVPQTVNDTTTGNSNSLQPSCGISTASEDFGYVFTAPADGSFTFDTFGTGFDTVLHVTDGAVCGGLELECNDDTGGLQSQVTVNLDADQQVVVMVDGYNGADGPFTLNVN